MRQYDQGCAQMGSTFAAFWGACRDDIVQQIGHQESGALNVTASDRHACLEHWQQFAYSHIQTVRIAMHMSRFRCSCGAVQQRTNCKQHLQERSGFAGSASKEVVTVNCEGICYIRPVQESFDSTIA